MCCRLQRHGLAKAAGLSSIWSFVVADEFTVGFEKRPEDIEDARTDINLCLCRAAVTAGQERSDAVTPVVPEAIPGRLSRDFRSLKIVAQDSMQFRPHYPVRRTEPLAMILNGHGS
jgi:hypothetical protein